MNEDSPRIILVRIAAFSKALRPLSDFVKVALMIIEILLQEDDNFTISGEVTLLTEQWGSKVYYNYFVTRKVKVKSLSKIDDKNSFSNVP